MPSVSVSLSGGGHRASLFALGALLYLADAGKNREVTQTAISRKASTIPLPPRRTSALGLARLRDALPAKALSGPRRSHGSTSLHCCC
jgi:hypothetical protein